VKSITNQLLKLEEKIAEKLIHTLRMPLCQCLDGNLSKNPCAGPKITVDEVVYKTEELLKLIDAFSRLKSEIVDLNDSDDAFESISDAIDEKDFISFQLRQHIEVLYQTAKQAQCVDHLEFESINDFSNLVLLDVVLTRAKEYNKNFCEIEIGMISKMIISLKMANKARVHIRYTCDESLNQKILKARGYPANTPTLECIKTAAESGESEV